MDDFGRILFVHDKCLTKKKGGRFLRILITRILAVLVTQHHWERERERVNIFISSKTCVVHNVEVHIVQVHIVQYKLGGAVHIVHID